MSDDPNRPVVLRTLPDEPQAALLVSALKRHGVEAQATGGLTSGFRAEAPGGVQVLVRHRDLARALAALRDIEEQRTDAGGGR